MFLEVLDGSIHIVDDIVLLTKLKNSTASVLNIALPLKISDINPIIRATKLFYPSFHKIFSMLKF